MTILASGVRRAASGACGHVAVDAVTELLDRPALTFAEWARDHADDFH